MRGYEFMVLIVMGVSGCGKSTTGRLLGTRLALPFFDADDFHPASNVDKMRQGTPLVDGDRQPWLEALSIKIADWEQKGGAVLACSALKKKYRDILQSRCGKAVRFVYLSGTAALIRERMLARKDHYMPPALLDSQFAALEPPRDAITVSIDAPPQTVVDAIVHALDKGGESA